MNGRNSKQSAQHEEVLYSIHEWDSIHILLVSGVKMSHNLV